MMTGRELIDELLTAIRAERVVLPSMPDIAQKVRTAVDDEGKTAADIAKIIQTDVSMTARLVQIANSPLYRGVTPAVSCRAVVSRLGMHVTRNLVTVFAMRRIFSSSNPVLLKRLQVLWDHSAQIAAVSSVLARLTPGLDSERALLAGLVHDVGLIPLNEFLYRQKLLDQPEIEQLLQTARGPVGREVLCAWRFDEELIDVPVHAEHIARESQHEADYSDVVAAAHWCVDKDIFDLGVASKEIPPVAKKFSVFSLGDDVSPEILADAQLDIVEMQGMLNH